MSVYLCIVARSGQTDFTHDGYVAFCERLIERIQEHFMIEDRNDVYRLYDRDEYYQVEFKILGEYSSFTVGPGYIEISHAYNYFQYYRTPAWARESSYALLAAAGLEDAWPCSEFLYDNGENCLDGMPSLDAWLEVHADKICEFDPSIHACTDDYPPHICHDGFADLKERNAQVLERLGMTVLHGHVTFCGWMLAKKNRDLFVLDRYGHPVVDSPIDSCEQDDVVIIIRRGRHTWAYTYMGDFLSEGDVPPEELNRYRQRRFDRDGRLVIQVLSASGETLFEYEHE